MHYQLSLKELMSNIALNVVTYHTRGKIAEFILVPPQFLHYVPSAVKAFMMNVNRSRKFFQKSSVAKVDQYGLMDMASKMLAHQFPRDGYWNYFPQMPVFGNLEGNYSYPHNVNYGMPHNNFGMPYGGMPQNENFAIQPPQLVARPKLETIKED
jgi:hypothetical protein